MSSKAKVVERTAELRRTTGESRSCAGALPGILASNTLEGRSVVGSGRRDVRILLRQ